MERINYIIRTINDEDGITKAITDELEQKYDVAKGIVYEWHESKRAREEGKIVYKRTRPLYTHDCLEYSQELPPIDGSLLESLLPYKEMAMHIMCREIHYDIYERRYLEKVYYRILRYWANEIISNNINLVIFMVTPHHCGEYILYALCRVKNIKTVILYPQLANNGVGFFLGNTLENTGESIATRYEQIKDSDIELSEFMQGIYANAKGNIVMSLKDPKAMNTEVRKMFLAKNSLKIIKKDVFRILKIKLNILKMNNKQRSLDYYRRLCDIRIKSRIYEKKMDHIDDYEKLSKKIDPKEKYIYMPLHMQPEASTLPMAGVFEDQMIMLSMLSFFANKYGFKIYVKEHYVQVNREPGFYKRISDLANVDLITLEENSLNLIRKSMAVASITGNCLLEALINKKYALAFGDGHCFKGAPNILQVKSNAELEESLNIILTRKPSFEDADIKRYLRAIQDEMVYSYIDGLKEVYSDYDKNKTAKKIVDYIDWY